MYPIGHVAVSYLAAQSLGRRSLSFVELAALTAGTLFPAASNMGLQNANVFGINHTWSHSPLIPLVLILFGLVVLKTRFPLRRVPLIFAPGIASHLIIDILFDFPLILFSNRVDDIGGPWFYPWQPFLIRYEEPGFEIVAWELILEGLFLAWMVRRWRRWDLAAYSVIVAAITVGWLAVREGRI